MIDQRHVLPLYVGANSCVCIKCRYVWVQQAGRRARNFESQSACAEPLTVRCVRPDSTAFAICTLLLCSLFIHSSVTDLVSIRFIKPHKASA